MKIDNQITQANMLPSVRAPRAVQVQQPEKSMRKAGDQVEVASKNQRIQPASLLSMDELTMLHRLFPEQGTAPLKVDMYAKNSAAMKAAPLGHIVDLKK